MTNPDVITSQTNASLREAAARYSATIAVPCFVKDVDGFAGAYLDEAQEDTSTLITGSSEWLAISVEGSNHDRKAFINIDLDVPGDGLASIVAPGMYNERGEHDVEHGTMQRPVVRALTEREGQELAMDLHALIAKIPKDRHRS